MAIALGDNLGVTGPLPTDNRYYNTGNNLPWTGCTQVNAAITGARYTGLTVNIAGTEYWYKDGILDACLIEKTSSGGGTITGGTNGLSTSGANIVLGGTLTSNPTICTTDSFALYLAGTTHTMAIQYGNEIWFNRGNVGDSFISAKGSDNSMVLSVTDASDNTQTAICMTAGGGVNLYHSGTSKFITTATGVYVCGETCATGPINLYGNSNLQLIASAASTDSGDVVFFTGGTTTSSEWARIWISSADGCLLYRSACDGLTERCVWHSGSPIITAPAICATSCAVITSTGAIYSGVPSLCISDTTTRGTILLESQADQPTDFFMKSNGKLTFDWSVRNSASNHAMNLYTSSGGSSWDGQPVMTISTGGTFLFQSSTGENSIYALEKDCVALYYNGSEKFKTVTGGACTVGIHCATTCFKAPAITLTTGAGAGCVLQSDGSGNATWATPAGSGIAMSGSTVDGLTTYVDANTVCAHQYLQWNGTTLNLSGATTGSRAIQIGQGRTDDGYAYIDLIGDTTYTDYGLRILRSNGGSGTTSQIVHKGTGSLQIETPEGGAIALIHAAAVKMCTTTGRVCFPDGIDVECPGSSTAAIIRGNVADSGTQTAFQSSLKGTAGGQYTAIYGDAFSVTAETEGRSTGVLGVAGNRTSGYNAGVVGAICGTNDGAGVLGTTGSLPFGYSGIWAGYFCGPVYNTTTLCQGGDIHFDQGAARTICLDTEASGVGQILNICAGTAAAGTNCGGGAGLYGGVGGVGAGASNGGFGGYSIIWGGAGGAATATAGAGGRAIVRGGAGGAGATGGVGGAVEICGGVGGGVAVDGDVCICGNQLKINMTDSNAIQLRSQTTCDPYISFHCDDISETRIGYVRGCGTLNTMSIVNDGGGSLILDNTSSCFISCSVAYICGVSGVYMYGGASLNAYVTSTGAYLRYGGVTKLNTITNGVCVTGCGCATDWIASSDCRLKTCIEPITGALSTVTQLCGVCYQLCADEKHENRIGLIAQDVEKILPVVVSHTTKIVEEENPNEEPNEYDDLLGIKYDKLTAVLIEAIKEQQTQITCLQQEINELKNK